MHSLAPLPERALTVSALSCRRGDNLLFEELGFTLAAGRALLLRGPNGAGKTSLLMCLAGILRPEAGAIVWQGRDPEMQPGADLHFVGHRPALKPDLTVRENLTFWVELCGAPASGVAPALTAAGLAHAAGLRTGWLSAGQTRRLALARLIAIPRPVWLLDEPTSALDKDGDKWVSSLIDSHLAAGGLVIAATHLDLALADPARVQTLALGGTP